MSSLLQRKQATRVMMSYRPDCWKFNASLPTGDPERATNK
jgi:hypothetical protein